MKSEAKIQQEIYEWYNNNYCKKTDKNRQIIFHVPNENQYRLMSIGVLAGVADLILTIEGVIFFIEVKDEKGRMSKSQKEFEKRIKALGFNYYCTRSLEDFKRYVRFTMIAVFDKYAIEGSLPSDKTYGL